MAHQNSNDKTSWVSPDMKPLTKTNTRADRRDVPVRNSGDESGDN
jgi:hypothetical protein